MDKKIMNRLYMLENVQAFLDAHGEPFNKDAQFLSLQGELKTRIDSIKELQLEHSDLRQSVSPEKQQQFEMYVNRLHMLSRVLEEVAAAKSDITLEQFSMDVRSRIKYEPVADSLNAARQLIVRAEENRSDIEGMSKGKKIIDDAQPALDAYSSVALLPIQRRTESGELNDRFKDEVMEAGKFVRKSLYNFFFAWKEEHPYVFGLFEENMRLTRYGSRSANNDNSSEMEDAFYFMDDPELNEDLLSGSEEDTDGSSEEVA